MWYICHLWYRCQVAAPRSLSRRPTPSARHWESPSSVSHDRLHSGDRDHKAGDEKPPYVEPICQLFRISKDSMSCYRSSAENANFPDTPQTAFQNSIRQWSPGFLTFLYDMFGIFWSLVYSHFVYFDSFNGIPIVTRVYDFEIRNSQWVNHLL